MIGVLLLVKPPAFGIPSLGDAFLGWLVGVLLLAAPSAALSWRSHTVLGHWTRHFAQWHRRSWWLVTAGSISLGLGALGLLGALPSWQTRWATWQAQATQAQADPTALQWLTQTQEQFTQLLRLASIALVIVGVAAVAVGGWHMTRSVLVRRQAVAPTSEWMMAPPVTRPHTDG